MIKKTIKYEDYDGNECIEECWFHLNKAELIDLETSVDGGYGEKIKEIAESGNPKDVLSVMKTLIIKSYGVRSADGKHFTKDEQITKDFENSEAFSELYAELCTNADAAADFINGIIPKIANVNPAALPEKR